MPCMGQYGFREMRDLNPSLPKGVREAPADR